MLSTDTGRPFDQIATGHSRYSAVTFFNGMAFVGGGDPPYHGRLYAFDITDREQHPHYLCKTETVGARDGCSSFTLHVDVANCLNPIHTVRLDSSALSETISNGAHGEIACSSRDGNHFTFDVPLRNTIVSGRYCVDLNVDLDDGTTLCRTALVDIARSDTLPTRVFLHNIRPVAQISPRHSGAAAIEMGRRYYGQPTSDQATFRQLVEDVRSASGYAPFDLWRIVTRRALSATQHRFDELPEVQRGEQSLR